MACAFYYTFKFPLLLKAENGIIKETKRREAVDVTIQQKIECACTIAGITKTELGRRLGMSQSAISQRIKTGKFSDEDFKRMAEALGAKYFSGFEFPDGTRVE